jgi:hypothetical protein
VEGCRRRLTNDESEGGSRDRCVEIAPSRALCLEREVRECYHYELV